jgi:hypothetical protein
MDMFERQRQQRVGAGAGGASSSSSSSSSSSASSASSSHSRSAAGVTDLDGLQNDEAWQGDLPDDIQEGAGAAAVAAAGARRQFPAAAASSSSSSSAASAARGASSHTGGRGARRAEPLTLADLNEDSLQRILRGVLSDRETAGGSAAAAPPPSSSSSSSSPPPSLQALVSSLGVLLENDLLSLARMLDHPLDEAFVKVNHAYAVKSVVYERAILQIATEIADVPVPVPDAALQVKWKAALDSVPTDLTADMLQHRLLIFSHILDRGFCVSPLEQGHLLVSKVAFVDGFPVSPTEPLSNPKGNGPAESMNLAIAIMHAYLGAGVRLDIDNTARGWDSGRAAKAGTTEEVSLMASLIVRAFPRIISFGQDANQALSLAVKNKSSSSARPCGTELGLKEDRYALKSAVNILVSAPHTQNALPYQAEIALTTAETYDVILGHLNQALYEKSPPFSMRAITALLLRGTGRGKPATFARLAKERKEELVKGVITAFGAASAFVRLRLMGAGVLNDAHIQQYQFLSSKGRVSALKGGKSAVAVFLSLAGMATGSGGEWLSALLLMRSLLRARPFLAALTPLTRPLPPSLPPSPPTPQDHCLLDTSVRIHQSPGKPTGSSLVKPRFSAHMRQVHQRRE